MEGANGGWGGEAFRSHYVRVGSVQRHNRILDAFLLAKVSRLPTYTSGKGLDLDYVEDGTPNAIVHGRPVLVVLAGTDNEAFLSVSMRREA